MEAILVIETDAEHIEDLYVEHIWNDYVLVDLGKEFHFKPMPQKKETRNVIQYRGLAEEYRKEGWNECIDEILGETE